MYRNADEIEQLKKIKADSDQEMATALQQLKDLSESRDLMQRELVELRELKDAAQAMADIVEIPEGNKDEPLNASESHGYLRDVSTTTRQYVGHVLGLVKSYWPRTPLDSLGEGAKADYNDDQFGQYLEETSTIGDRIVETLNKS